MLPGVLLNARSTTPYVSTEQISYLSNVIPSETQMLLPLTAFCAGLLAAAAMFGYLYTPRSAGLAASLPIRRGCMFRTHLLAGLLMLLSAEAVIFGLAVLIEATRLNSSSSRCSSGWAYSRSRRSYSTASPCCAPCSPATWSCCRACTCS